MSWPRSLEPELEIPATLYSGEVGLREIHHVARVYSLFDVAQILLAGRDRYQLNFTLAGNAPPLFRSLRSRRNRP